MKNLLTLLAIFITSISFGQKLRYDKIDDYKHERIIQHQASQVRTWMVSDGITKNFLKRNIYLMTHIVQNTDTKEAEVFLTLDVRDKTKICSSEGNEAIITLNNGHLVKLTQSSKTECGTEINIKFLLNETQIKQLSNYDATNIRIYLNDGYTNREIKEKSKQVIKKTLQMTADKLKEIE